MRAKATHHLIKEAVRKLGFKIIVDWIHQDKGYAEALSNVVCPIHVLPFTYCLFHWQFNCMIHSSMIRSVQSSAKSGWRLKEWLRWPANYSQGGNNAAPDGVKANVSFFLTRNVVSQLCLTLALQEPLCLIVKRANPYHTKIFLSLLHSICILQDGKVAQKEVSQASLQLTSKWWSQWGGDSSLNVSFNSNSSLSPPSSLYHLNIPLLI